MANFIISPKAERAAKSNNFAEFLEEIVGNNKEFFKGGTKEGNSKYANSIFTSIKDSTKGGYSGAGFVGGGAGGGSGGGGGKGILGMLGGGAKGLAGLLDTGLSDNKFPEYVISFKDAVDLFLDSSKQELALNPLKIISNIIEKTGESIAIYLKQQSDLQEEINTKTSLTGELSKKFREEITKSAINATKLGYSFGEIAQASSELLVQSGRFKIVSSETMDNIALTSKIFYDGLDDGVAAVAEFQKVSRGAQDAMKATEKIGKGSLKIGLNARETVKTVRENLGYLNAFGFKNGIEGLTKMTQKAQALRMDMSDTFRLAEKVMNPEDALSLAANLQVIGGALGDFNDPIKLMYMSTNNVEGLQDALVGSLNALVDFSQESKTFEITGANLRRLHAMATELGVDYKSLANTAIQSAQRVSAANDIMASGISVDEDQREFLTNLAQMKEGKMVIEVPKDLRSQLNLDAGETSIALESLNDKQAALILEQRKQFEDPTMEELAQQQVSIQTNMERSLKFIASKTIAGLGQGGLKVLESAGYNPELAQKEIIEFRDKAGESLDKAIQFATNKIVELGSKGVDFTKLVIEEIKGMNFSEVVEKAKTTFEDVKKDLIGAGVNSENVTTNLNNFLEQFKSKATEKGITEESLKSFANQSLENIKNVLSTSGLGGEQVNSILSKFSNKFDAIITTASEKTARETETLNRKVAETKDNKVVETTDGTITTSISSLADAINNAKTEINTQSVNLETGAKTMGDILTSVNNTLPNILSKYESIISRYEAVGNAPKKIDINITSDAVFDTLKRELVKDNVFISEVKKSIDKLYV